MALPEAALEEELLGRVNTRIKQPLRRLLNRPASVSLLRHVLPPVRVFSPTNTFVTHDETQVKRALEYKLSACYILTMRLKELTKGVRDSRRPRLGGDSVITTKEDLIATLHIRVDAALLSKIDHVCRHKRRKRSDVVRQLLEYALSDKQSPDPTK